MTQNKKLPTALCDENCEIIDGVCVGGICRKKDSCDKCITSYGLGVKPGHSIVCSCPCQQPKECKGSMVKCPAGKHYDWCNGCFQSCPDCPKESQPKDKKLIRDRIIKFRAWDVEFREMVYGRSVNFRDENWRVDPEPNCEIEYCPGGYISSGGGNVLMQFTGLKDKNGKEIYEGDILSTKKGRNVVVEWQSNVWSHPGFGVFDRKKDEDGVERRYNELNIYYFASKREVIGNIYENPNLIK